MYRTLQECLDDLEAAGQLVRIEEPVDANLEAAEIQRRVFRAGGPAIFYAPRRRLPLSDGEQPVRHDRAGAVYVPRFAGKACSSWWRCRSIRPT